MSGGRNEAMMRLASGVALVAALGGCVQATRHSNAVIFGTNTSLGIKVGTSTAEVPTIIVGYDRQEGVVMPLVANTGDAADGVRSRLTPCNLTTPVNSTGRGFAVHPCSLVAVRGQALDSYSVLASFGANFRAESNNPNASGGLAQYFATGMAAQLLAASGGASVVNAARPEGNSPNRDAVRSLEEEFGDVPAFSAGLPIGQSSSTINENLIAKIQLTPIAELPAKIAAFEAAIDAAGRLTNSCSTDRAICIGRVRSGAYTVEITEDISRAETALSAWSVS